MRCRMFLVLGLAACAGHAPVTKAPEFVYNTDFATVWNAVSAEMHERFHDDGIKTENAAAGIVVSRWKGMAQSLTQEETGETGEALQVSSRGTVRHNASALAGDMVQISVKVQEGGPPWRVVVFAEGAHRSPNSSMLKPYHRGAADEPIWVQGKIDSMREALYDRLKPFAVVAAPGRVETPPVTIEKP